MSKSFRRYEILLPRTYNDGSAVPNALIGETLLELRQRFGAVSSETQTIHGSWSHLGQVYSDALVRLFVDVEDEPEARQFFQEFKERLKPRFRQIDIWITTYPIDVL
jgi:hypothetical protein